MQQFYAILFTNVWIAGLGWNGKGKDFISLVWIIKIGREEKKENGGIFMCNLTIFLSTPN